MIRYYIKILIIVLSLTSCKKQEGISTRQLISNYNLESYGDYKGAKKQQNKWFSKDSMQIFTLYENHKTNHFLYIVQNKKNDTIFKFFDSAAIELKIRDFVKLNNSYYVTLWEPSLENYKGKLTLPNSKNDNYESLYRYDSLNIYKIDTLSYLLTKIEKPSLKHIEETAKRDFNIKGNFKAIKNNSKIRLIKSTLHNQKALYSYDVGLEIKKDNEEYSLEPYLFNESKIELDKNNLSSYSDRFLIDENFKGDIKYYYQYDNKYNNLGFSKIDFIFHQSNKQHVIKTSLDSLFVLDKNYRIKKIDSLSSLRVEAFKYKNGDYFFHVAQDPLEYWSGSFPIIYNIDTINWKIRRVVPIGNESDKKTKKLVETHKIEVLSNIHNSSLKFILEDFEIVRGNDEFKIIKTKQ
ncbi:MAG: hypothetical protein HRT67_02380 [Flavobacteriaceae bacterium]|nr:hypothetical protein [Flavobacteriaceae bacterium]